MSAAAPDLVKTLTDIRESALALATALKSNERPGHINYCSKSDGALRAEMLASLANAAIHKAKGGPQ